MKRQSRYSSTALLLTVGMLVLGLYQQWSLYQDYLNASGKTQTLFSLNVLQNYSTSLYMMPIAFLCFLLLAIAFYKKEPGRQVFLVLLLVVAALLLPFLGLWQLFV